jgi:hypothetical protein
MTMALFAVAAMIAISSMTTEQSVAVREDLPASDIVRGEENLALGLADIESSMASESLQEADDAHAQLTQKKRARGQSRGSSAMLLRRAKLKAWRAWHRLWREAENHPSGSHQLRLVQAPSATRTEDQLHTARMKADGAALDAKQASWEHRKVLHEAVAEIDSLSGVKSTQPRLPPSPLERLKAGMKTSIKHAHTQIEKATKRISAAHDQTKPKEQKQKAKARKAPEKSEKKKSEKKEKPTKASIELLALSHTKSRHPPHTMKVVKPPDADISEYPSTTQGWLAAEALRKGAEAEAREDAAVVAAAVRARTKRTYTESQKPTESQTSGHVSKKPPECTEWCQVPHPVGTKGAHAIGTGKIDAVISGVVRSKFRASSDDKAAYAKALEAAKKIASGYETCGAFAVNHAFGAVFFNKNALHQNGHPKKVNFDRLVERLCKRDYCTVPETYHETKGSHWTMFVKKSLVHLTNAEIAHFAKPVKSEVTELLVEVDNDTHTPSSTAEPTSAQLPSGITQKMLERKAQKAARASKSLLGKASHARQRASQLRKNSRLLKEEARRAESEATKIMDRAANDSLEHKAA